MDSLFDLHPLGGSPEELERRIGKLQKINAALMQRVERSMDPQANAYSLFQTAITLEGQVRLRTEEVNNALARLERTNDELSQRARRLRARQSLQDALLHRRRPRSAAAAARRATVGERAGRAERQRAPAPHRRAHRACADDDRGAAQIHPRHLQARGRACSRRPCGPWRSTTTSPPSCSTSSRRRAPRACRSRGAAAGSRVVSDPLMLRRILQNLLANAVQYTEKGGIRLLARRRGDERAHRGVGHRPRHRRSRPGDDLRGVPARIGDRPSGHRRLRPRSVDRAAHGRGARSPDRPVLPPRPRHALFAHRTLRRTAAARRPTATAPTALNFNVSALTGASVAVIDNDATVLDAMQALLERWDCDVRCAPQSLEASWRGAAPTASAPTSSSPTTISTTGATASTPCMRCASAFGTAIPAIIITADRSPAIAEAAREMDCELLLKPVKPAELRALMLHLLARAARRRSPASRRADRRGSNRNRSSPPRSPPACARRR